MLPSFLKRSPPLAPEDMTAAQVQERLARCQRSLAKMKNLGMVVAHATIFAAGLGCVAGLFALSLTYAGALVVGLIFGACTFFGTGYTYNSKIRLAQREEQELQEVLPGKMTQARAAEAAASIALKQKSAEDFKNAVQNGLPLEQSIVIKGGPLKLKTAAKPRHSFFGLRL
jgi:hypothetical protein